MSSTASKSHIDTGNLKGDEKVLAIAKERFKQCKEMSDEFRTNAKDDLRFFRGDQWDERLFKERENQGRPALTINKIPTFCNQIINDIRKNRPQAKIRPVDDVDDPDKAEVLNGLVRSIFNGNSSKNAIDTASFYQVVCGIGYFRILTRYIDEDSFEQEIYIDRIVNPFSVYFPIHLVNSIDFSDAPYCFIRTRISKDDFKELYPNSDEKSYTESGTGDEDWQDSDYIYICEYFDVVKTCKKKYLLKDGTTTTDKPEDANLIDKERDYYDTQIVWRKITGSEVLEEKTFPGKYIPVIPVVGQEFNIDGDKDFLSLTRTAKDPQAMYNYWHTAYTEQIALQPKAPFIAAEGQLEGYEDMWRTANTEAHDCLVYKPISEAGALLPAPQRQAPPQAGTAIIEGLRMAGEQMKEVTGIYDASLGSKGNETSGKAIIARQRQGDTANFHFVDNQGMAVLHCAKILVDLIPEYYDTDRAIRILGEDMKDKVVKINGQNADGKLYDLSVGKYDVVCDIGPSYETKRIETAQNLLNFAQGNPQIATAIGDLIMGALDFPLSNEAAERLKKVANLTFPGIAPDEQKKGKEISQDEVGQIVQDLQKLQQELQLSQQQNQQFTQMIQELQGQVKSKDQELAIRADTNALKHVETMKKFDLDKMKFVVEHNRGVEKSAVDAAFRIHELNQPAPNLAGQSAVGPKPT